MMAAELSRPGLDSRAVDQPTQVRHQSVRGPPATCQHCGVPVCVATLPIDDRLTGPSAIGLKRMPFLCTLTKLDYSSGPDALLRSRSTPCN